MYQTDYRAFQEPNIQEFLIECLDKSLAKLERDFGFPRKRIMEVADEFREGGYKNRWVHKTKRSKVHNVTGKLVFELTGHAFHLDFILEKRGECIYRERIRSTRPDENCFYGLYRDLTIERGAFKARGWQRPIEEMLD